MGFSIFFFLLIFIIVIVGIKYVIISIGCVIYEKTKNPTIAFRWCKSSVCDDKIYSLKTKRKHTNGCKEEKKIKAAKLHSSIICNRNNAQDAIG